MASVVPVANETRASLSRTTRDGRDLTYQITVIQQPERARACGSGAKSSADRRPVDPPPVVELKILEGPSKTDVTFGHNANFFLFTTLEPARPINHGRVAAAQTAAPVLTGAPVAGMVYLDRPSPAGYFIFPDLSVRHEGMYRLSFSLYEDVKEEKDDDPVSATGTPVVPENRAVAARQHVHFRLEVKSAAFSVYSAKKFPGLTESTGLSRTVAEQGCRVRIRRDVRMRRRDKPSDGEGQYAHSDRYSTPHHPMQGDRQRSLSNASMDPQTPYSLAGRRPSVHEVGGYYPAVQYQQQAHAQAPPPPPPPAPVHASTGYPSHLSFGPPTPTYPKPSIAAPPAPPTTHPSYAPPSNNYGHYQPPMQTRQAPMPSEYSPAPGNHQTYGYAPYSDPHRGSVGNRRISIESEYGAGNGYDGYHHKDIQQQQPISRALTPINTDTHSFPPHQPQHQQANTLPPVTQLLQQTSAENVVEPVSASSGVPQGPQNPYSAGATNLSSYSTSSSATMTHAPSAFPDPPARLQPPFGGASKRAYGNVFDTTHMTQPQHSGSRPNLMYSAQDIQKIETDDGDSVDPYGDISTTLVYKRANGSQQARKCPSPRDRRRTAV